MAMPLSRRDFARLLAGSAAGAALLQLGRTAASAAPVAGYKAMVGIFLFGGNDGFNMIVPTDARYAAYAAGRGGGIALPQASLGPLSGTTMALHPAMAPLRAVWDDGALNLVLNAGTLQQPLTKAQYLASPNLRPINLMSHTDEQAHWQGLRARAINVDGFMGRLTDRAGQTGIPSLLSLSGSNLILIGRSSAPLILPSTGTIVQTGANANAADPSIFARRSAVSAFADGTGAIGTATGQAISSAYAQSVTANAILTGTSTIDRYFVNPATGAALTSDIARQLLRIARLIEARGTLGQSRQTFFASQGGYDLHANAVTGDNSTGTHATLLGDLAAAMAGFHDAMTALGLPENVTAFTMSDFGRVYKGNAQRGADHAWGNNHLIMGKALKARTIHGTYPSPVLGGADDVNSDGRFLPTIAPEQYIGAIAKWHGVAEADLPYVFPNWATWSNIALPLFAG